MAALSSAKRCGFGSSYGTIRGLYVYFRPQLKHSERFIPPGKKFYTNPGKKGTGYGYADLTIGEQYLHEPGEVERINVKTSGSIPRKFYQSGFDLHFSFGDLKRERNHEQTARVESTVILLHCQKNGTTLS